MPPSARIANEDITCSISLASWTPPGVIFEKSIQAEFAKAA